MNCELCMHPRELHKGKDSTSGTTCSVEKCFCYCFVEPFHLREDKAVEVAPGEALQPIVEELDILREKCERYERGFLVIMQAVDEFAGAVGHLVEPAVLEAWKAAFKVLERELSATMIKPCAHEWIDARNEAVKSGEICLRCMSIRAGNETSGEQR